TSQNTRNPFRPNTPFTTLSDDERSLLDADSLSFIDLVTPRVPDGRNLYATMNAALRPPLPAKPALPADLGIAPADNAEVRTAAESWMEWYDRLIKQPTANNPTWSAERKENR